MYIPSSLFVSEFADEDEVLLPFNTNFHVVQVLGVGAKALLGHHLKLDLSCIDVYELQEVTEAGL